MYVVSPSGTQVSAFNLPITTIQLHTDATASASVPGINGWYVMGDIQNLVGPSPYSTGEHWQAYTMNTMQYIPGSDIPGAVGLVTGHYNYDQVRKQWIGEIWMRAAALFRPGPNTSRVVV